MYGECKMKKKLGRLLLILMTIFSLIVVVLLGLAFYGKYQIQASPIVVCTQATSYDRLQNRFLVSTTTFPVSEEATILLAGFSFYQDFEFAMFYKGLYTKKAYLVYTYLIDNDKKVIWSVFGGVCILVNAD